MNEFKNIIKFELGRKKYSLLLVAILFLPCELFYNQTQNVFLGGCVKGLLTSQFLALYKFDLKKCSFLSILPISQKELFKSIAVSKIIFGIILLITSILIYSVSEFIGLQKIESMYGLIFSDIFVYYLFLIGYLTIKYQELKIDNLFAKNTIREKLC